ncbi:MAG TPA: transketolase C-terminal domain-containing protein [Solirubrobacteraceae bacterium]|jgi:transketolase|nr:transketolase C-terminal domain-containing protein [Solirubrobacteraceae bacterium]
MSVAELFDCAEHFSAELLRLAGEDERICVVINDSAETHHATAFQQQLPERIIDVGIAEQNMVGVAAGLANAGRIPFVHSAACFLTARALEQIKADVAYCSSNVKLCGFVSGLAYGALGGTHHALEDIAWMRAIPNLRVIAPATANESRAAVRAMAACEDPVFVRVISKTLVPELFAENVEFRFGEATLLRAGGDVTLIGTGLTSTRLVDAAECLSRQGIDAGVLHIGSIAPLDSDAIAAHAALTGRLVVAEEHVTNGGLAGAVSEVVVRTHPVPLLSLGVPNVFAPIGPTDWLHEHFGLTAERLAGAVAAWMDEPADGDA